MDLLQILPLEDVLFPRIFFHLSTEELFRLRRVSRSWHHIVMKYFKRCSKIDLSKLGKQMTSDAFVLMTDGNEILRSLLLPDATHWLTDVHILPVIQSCRMLSAVDLSNCSQLTNRTLFALATNCRALTAISFNGCHWIDTDNFKLLVTNNRHLVKLNVSSCWSLDDHCIILAATSCLDLEELDCSKIYSITDNSLQALATNCPHLTHLAVRGCWRVSNQGIRTIGEYCKNLRELQVSDCRDVTEASLARLRVRKVTIDVPASTEATLRRLESRFHYVRPYVNLPI